MYLSFFELERLPFEAAPDPHFLYVSPSHAEGLATIEYGIAMRKGLLVLTGEVGLGKTTLVRSYLSRADQSKLKIVYVFHPRLQFGELLAMLAQELGVELHGLGEFALLNLIQRRLIEHYAAGGQMVVVVDEAQRLPPDTLENLRLLSNLETETEKLLQILLVGQTELDELLARPDLRQLRQRIALQAHLSPLSRPQAEAYIQFRLTQAGSVYPLGVFSPRAIAALAKAGRGVPREINILADRCLIEGFAAQQRPVQARIVRAAAREMRARPARAGSARRWLPGGVAAAAACAVAALIVAANPDITGSWRALRNLAVVPSSDARDPVAQAPAETSISRLEPPLAAAPPAEAPGETVPAPASRAPATADPPVEPPIEPPPRPALAEADPDAGLRSAAPALPAPSPDARERERKVKWGDTLIGLLKDAYGVASADAFQQVIKRNPQLQAREDRLQIGELLYFPALPQKPDAAPTLRAR
jgi:general secretion pathway protein A